jgi:hypothetical protein
MTKQFSEKYRQVLSALRSGQIARCKNANVVNAEIKIGFML